ncbi:hypothetical protein CEXT_395431 [Caerostris extrusa]|uniref:Uncharacterized protein n=1 Tax=Caerostris extrusa TaxID=172846 RepID=A0AAV4XE29_CAEEX|nr:hypothetical protein CEXT_395431 [Caerostris extrusa]
MECVGGASEAIYRFLSREKRRPRTFARVELSRDIEHRRRMKSSPTPLARVKGEAPIDGKLQFGTFSFRLGTN